jgi:hypothetical protein
MTYTASCSVLVVLCQIFLMALLFEKPSRPAWCFHQAEAAE